MPDGGGSIKSAGGKQATSGGMKEGCLDFAQMLKTLLRAAIRDLRRSNAPLFREHSAFDQQESAGSKRGSGPRGGQRSMSLS